MLPLPLALPAVLLQSPAADWEALERRGAVIGEIRIIQADVFDLASPDEDNLVGRLGDKLHRTTRESVVRRALLFRVGEKVNARRIHETERYLRAQLYLKDAGIQPETLPDGSVRAVVRVRDAWTLKGSINYKLVGGQETKGLGLQDQNLLGTGKTLAFSWLQDPVRITRTFAYFDPQLLGGDWTMSTAYQSLSDGSTRILNLQRPYTSLDQTWSASAQVLSSGSTFTLYDRGISVYAAHSQLDTLSLGGSFAAYHDGRQAWRPGFLLVGEEAKYGPLSTLAPPSSLPAPDLAHRRLQGPALTVSYLEDGYRVFRNLAAMDTPEDYNVGWAGSAMGGLYLPSWSSTERAWFGQAALSRGWSGSERSLLLAQASASGRKGPLGWEDALANLTLVGYWKETEHEVTAVRAAFDRARLPDPEDLFYVGGLQGLRGYPNWLHPGDGRWLVNAEQRMLTEHRWLGTLRLGFVAFADVGGIHRLDGTGWSPTYKDVGAGLRLGDLKSSLGKVVLLTVAVPHSSKEPGQRGWQFALGNLTQF